MRTIEQNKFFLLLMMTLSLVLASMAAKAEGELEGSCRAKAKEVAVQAYQSCMTDNRAAKIKEIRESFEREQAEMKTKFDRLLKEAGAPMPAAAPVTTRPAPAKKVAKAPRKSRSKAIAPRSSEEPVSGIAQRLPPKRNHNGPALPIQNVSEDQPVVAASNNDIPEIVPVTEPSGTEDVLPSSDDASF